MNTDNKNDKNNAAGSPILENRQSHQRSSDDFGGVVENDEGRNKFTGSVGNTHGNTEEDVVLPDSVLSATAGDNYDDIGYDVNVESDDENDSLSDGSSRGSKKKILMDDGQESDIQSEEVEDGVGDEEFFDSDFVGSKEIKEQNDKIMSGNDYNESDDNADDNEFLSEPFNDNETSGHKGNGKWIFIIIAVILVVALTAGVILFSVTGNKSGRTDSGSSSLKDDSKSYDASAIAMSSDNYQLTEAQLAFFFNYLYGNYKSQLAQNGVDITKSLKDQAYSDTESWYDYIVSDVKNMLTQNITLSEAAIADKFEFDKDEMNKNSDAFISSLKAAAESADTSLDSYIVSQFGEGVTEDVVRSCVDLSYTANAYYNHLVDSVDCSEKKLEEYAKAYPSLIYMCDYKTYSFEYQTDSSSSGDSSDTMMLLTEKEARKAAEELAKATSSSSFDDLLRKYLLSAKNKMTTDEIKQAVSSAEVTEAEYDVSDEAGKWLFGNSAKEGTTYIASEKGSYTVYLLTRAKYRNESTLRSVRHILFTPSNYDNNDKKASEKAIEVYNSWKKNGKDEDSFATLAAKYSEDTGSASNGGLYKDVTEGQMVSEFNDWLFDSSRKKGDSAIVKTTYGYHIMYYVGESETKVWESTAAQGIKQNEIQSAYSGFLESYKIKTDDSTLTNLPEVIDETTGSPDNSSK